MEPAGLLAEMPGSQIARRAARSPHQSNGALASTLPLHLFVGNHRPHPQKTKMPASQNQPGDRLQLHTLIGPAGRWTYGNVLGTRMCFLHIPL